MRMEYSRDVQEVTVEVVPQTVTEIIYLSEPELINGEPNYYIPSEEELEDNEKLYEIGSVNPAQLQHMSLILDESQSFVLLSQDEHSYELNASGLAEEESSLDTNRSDFEKPCFEHTCDVCNMKCRSKKNLNCHKLIHTELAILQPLNTKYACKVCGLNFDKPQLMSYHFKICHESPKCLCNICGFPCNNNRALVAHIKEHKSQQCNNQTISAQKYENDTTLFANSVKPRSKRFICDVCNSGYDNFVDLNNHKKTHSTDLLYACNKCNAEFSSISAVSTHLRNVHSKPKIVQYSKHSTNVDFVDCYTIMKKLEEESKCDNSSEGDIGANVDVTSETVNEAYSRNYRKRKR